VRPYFISAQRAIIPVKGGEGSPRQPENYETKPIFLGKSKA
jgi:hypothetical protein